MKSKTVLIDGDVLVYRACFAVERPLYIVLDEGEVVYQSLTKSGALEYLKDNEGEIETTTLCSPITHAKYNIKSMIRRTIKDTKADNYKVFLTDVDGKKNFRHDIAVSYPYKGNRNGRKPEYYSQIREYLVDTWNAEMISGHEADDALGYSQTDDTIIASIDKDMLMVPGEHYNFITRLITISNDPGGLILDKDKAGNWKLTGTGFKWFCAQMLLGDRVDNIIGVKGYGPVKVSKVLGDATTYRQMWGRVKRVYYRTGNIDRLIENANLLWIWREKDGRFDQERIRQNRK